MGDLTWVEIVVLNETLDQVKNILPNYAGVTIGVSLSVFIFYEVSNGRIDEQDELTESGIPYDYEWGKGDNYDAGSKYIRFTPEGEVQNIEYFESEVNPPLEELLELVDQPEKLAQYVRDYSAEKIPLPWDNQVEYGKRYRTLQLIQY